MANHKLIVVTVEDNNNDRDDILISNDTVKIMDGRTGDIKYSHKLGQGRKSVKIECN